MLKEKPFKNFKNSYTKILPQKEKPHQKGCPVSYTSSNRKLLLIMHSCRISTVVKISFYGTWIKEGRRLSSSRQQMCNYCCQGPSRTCYTADELHSSFLTQLICFGHLTVDIYLSLSSSFPFTIPSDVICFPPYLLLQCHVPLILI